MKSTNNFTTDAFIVTYKRDDNLPRVVAGLRRQKFIRDIIIFHNAPSKRAIEGVTNIYSDKNYGCLARHAVALMMNSDYALFVDDDLELMADFSDRFIEGITLHQGSVIGLIGRTLNANEREKPYQSSSRLDNISSMQLVDVVIGRCHLCKRSTLLNSFDFITKNQFKVNGLREGDFIMDDIILNLATQLKTKFPSIVIPTKPEELSNLPDAFGAEYQENHYELRDEIIKEFFKLGWTPLQENSNYEEQNISLNSHV